MAAEDANAGAELKVETARESRWARLPYMLLFVIAFGIGQTLLNVAALVQALLIALKREPNGFLVEFGRSLAIWQAHTTGYLTCATEERPFPFAPWPSSHS